MLQTTFVKLFAFFALVAVVYAKTEAEMDQPTKLLGGILKKPEKCGYKVSSNSEIKLHYRARAWGEDSFYENSFVQGEPLKYKLGRDKIMKGLEQGIHGMCTGEVRRLLIPADLAYGELGLPNAVPPNTAVIYEVEIINVNSPFTNFWFWSGVVALVGTYFLMNRYQNRMSQSQSAEFLSKKAEEKKSE